MKVQVFSEPFSFLRRTGTSIGENWWWNVSITFDFSPRELLIHLSFSFELKSSFTMRTMETIHTEQSGFRWINWERSLEPLGRKFFGVVVKQIHSHSKVLVNICIFFAYLCSSIHHLRCARIQIEITFEVVGFFFLLNFLLFFRCMNFIEIGRMVTINEPVFSTISEMCEAAFFLCLLLLFLVWPFYFTVYSLFFLSTKIFCLSISFKRGEKKFQK